MSFDLGPVAVNRLSLHRKMVDWKDSSDKHHRWFGNRAVSGCDPQGSLVVDWGESISSESPTSSRIALPVVKAAVAIFLGSSMSFDLGPVAVNRLSLHRKMVDWKDSSDKHHRWFGNRAVSGCDPQGSLVVDWGESISVKMFRSEP
ncbi:hypothetical protein J6590_100672 [Homalodisca vitripennis]|nr:hypothetical protein J6590_100672 [Homalodisca vitripennis]